MSTVARAALCSLGAIVFLLGGILCACGVSSEVTTPASGQMTATSQPSLAQITPTLQTTVERANWVEVVYFHRTQRCTTCRRAETGVRYTIDTYFQDELASGKLVFMVLDLGDKANADMVDKYEPYGSSLYINDIEDGIDHIDNLIEIWFLNGDQQKMASALKAEIEERLGQ